MSDRFAGSAVSARLLPSRQLATSRGLGWQDLLARTFADPPVADPFETVPSPDLLLVWNVTGSLRIDSRRGAGWHGAAYRPWSVAATAPGRGGVLRWRASGREPVSSLHVLVHHELLHRTADALGGRVRAVPDALLLDDPLVRELGPVLLAALRHRAPALYADSMAQALASHLLLAPGAGAARPPGGLSGRQLRAVREYVEAHLAADVTLGDLAAAAHLSRYHFARAFRRSTGTTPHRYVVEVRLRHARDLLAGTDDPVAAVARACGWSSPAQFAAAFRRVTGTSPSAYRRRHGRRAIPG